MRRLVSSVDAALVLFIVVVGASCTLTKSSDATSTATAPARVSVLPPNPRGLHRWDLAHIPVHYCVDESGGDGYASKDEFRSMVQIAFETWGVPSQNDGRCAAPSRFRDGVNEVGWGRLQPSVPPGDVFEAGLTSLSFQACLGCGADAAAAIMEADITIDGSPPQEFQTRRCLLGTLLHEVGHFLGLEHAPAPAIMQAQTSGCILALTDGDREALNARYGPSIADASTGRGGAAPSSGAEVPVSDEAAVRALISRQFDLFRLQNWPEAYKTYAPRFHALCPFDEFVAKESTPTKDFDPSKVGLTDLGVRIDGDRAYATYTYTYDSKPITVVNAADPDVYVRIDGTWYDDIDSHTKC